MPQSALKQILAIAFLAGFANTAHAEGLYGSLLLGGSVETNDVRAYGENIAVDPDFPANFDAGDGAIAGIGLGYIINRQFRIEGRLAFYDTDFNSRRLGTGARAGEEYILDGSLRSTTLTAEVFYDLPTSLPLSPYVKAGVGIALNKYSARLGGAGVAAFDGLDGVADGFYDAYPDQSSTELTWNVGLGISYRITNTLNLFGEYQYVTLGDSQTGQDQFTDGFSVDSSKHTVTIGLRAQF
ncbi:MAG: outer membrane protein [Burkholderiaceae bacterium]